MEFFQNLEGGMYFLGLQIALLGRYHSADTVTMVIGSPVVHLSTAKPAIVSGCKSLGAGSNYGVFSVPTILLPTATMGTQPIGAIVISP